MVKYLQARIETRGNRRTQHREAIMSAQGKDLPSEKELLTIIDKLLAREGDFTTPKSKMVFLNKLHKYQKMLLAIRDGHPEKWPEYEMTPSAQSA